MHPDRGLIVYRVVTCILGFLILVSVGANTYAFYREKPSIDEFMLHQKKFNRAWMRYAEFEGWKPDAKYWEPDSMVVK